MFLKVVVVDAETSKECRCDCPADHKPKRQLLLLSCHCGGKLSTTKCVCVKLKVSICAIQTHTASFPHHYKKNEVTVVNIS